MWASGLMDAVERRKWLFTLKLNAPLSWINLGTAAALLACTSSLVRAQSVLFGVPGHGLAV